MSEQNVSKSTLQTVAVAVTEAQAKAIRKLSLRGNDSAEQIANKLFASVVKGRFKAVSLTIAEDAAANFDRSVNGGFTPPMERADYIKKYAAEYNEILQDL